MPDRIELTLRPKPDAKPLDEATAARIARVAHAETVVRGEGGAAFGFPSGVDGAVARGNLELAARFELGAHWHTRYEVIGP